MIKLFKTAMCYIIEVDDMDIRFAAYTAMSNLRGTRYASTMNNSSANRITLTSTKTREQIVQYLNASFGNICDINDNGIVIEMTKKQGRA